MRRYPLDCAWSVYRTLFLSGLDWSYSLEDIALFFRMEDSLHAHWQAILGERILTVDYADLVHAPETQIQRIMTHCGLALEPAQLQPHRTKRKIITASVAQVREPINTKGLNSSAPYRHMMAAFSDTYFG